MRRLSGFTLVEVIVAVVLINVGMLALVAASAVLIRQSAESRSRSAALHAAANRLSQLGATSCAARNGNASGPFGVREEWAVRVLRDGIRELHDSVSYASPSGTKSVVLRTRLPC